MRRYTIALFIKEDNDTEMKFYWNIEPKQELIDQLRISALNDDYEEAVETCNAVLDMKVYSAINKATKIKNFQAQENEQ